MVYTYSTRLELSSVPSEKRGVDMKLLIKIPWCFCGRTFTAGSFQTSEQTIKSIIFTNKTTTKPLKHYCV